MGATAPAPQGTQGALTQPCSRSQKDENSRNKHDCVQGAAGSQRHRQEQKVALGMPRTQQQTSPQAV